MDAADGAVRRQWKRGKTNLLEVLALACGTRASLWQVARRALVPDPGAVSVMVQGPPRLLPVSPDASLQFTGRDVALSSPFDGLAAAGAWWQALGVERGTTWSEGIRSGVLPDEVARLVQHVSRRPLIRYHLESIGGVNEARLHQRGRWLLDEDVNGDPTTVTFGRRFSRTLALPAPPPKWLMSKADDLPELFAPFRRWLAEPADERSAHPDLLELTPSADIPVQLTWLATERTTAEAWFDLYEAFESALMPTSHLLADLKSRGLGAEADDDIYLAYAKWWLSVEAAEAAAPVLRTGAPGLTISAEDDDESMLAVYLSSDSSRPLGFLRDTLLFDRLSSGERTWLDTALAHSAAELDELGVRNAWRSLGLGAVSEQCSEALAAEYLSAEPSYEVEDLRRIGSTIDRESGGPEAALAGRVRSDQAPVDLQETIWMMSMPGLEAMLVRPRPVRVHDEPERHLHPGRQRAAAEALDGVDAHDTIIATHSHLFLGRPGWQHIHLRKTDGGQIEIHSFDPAELGLDDDLVKELGLNRGELLAFTRYVLFVEGLVDEIVLTGLYGSLLNDAGVLVLPMSGIDEVASLTELRLIGQVLDVGVGVLADNARAGILDTGVLPSSATKEEEALVELQRLLRRRGSRIDVYGLKEVDVIAYLDEGAIRQVAPGFPGWEAVRAEARRTRSPFKDVVEQLAGVRVRRHLVTDVVRRMVATGAPARGDLPAVVTAIVNRARACT